MPANGFNAKNAQMPPNTAILKASAVNFDILYLPKNGKTLVKIL
jgi:hypothetical protein